MCGIMVLAADFGSYMSQAPQTAIFEWIICRNHFEVRDFANEILRVPHEGDLCKSEVVQGELALLLGYKDGLDVLSSTFEIPIEAVSSTNYL